MRWDWSEFIGLKEKNPKERLERQITEDEAMLAEEWQRIDEIDRGQMWKAGANPKPEKKWDWSRFKGIRDKHTSEERAQRRKRRYKRDKRGRFTK